MHIVADTNSSPAIGAETGRAESAHNVLLTTEETIVSEHDWQVPPTEWRYDGRPLAEDVADPMTLAHERVRVRFGGDLPRDVCLALNEAYRRGVADERERIAAECEQVSGNRSPALSNEDNRRYSDIYASVADRIRHPERYSGCAASTDGCSPNPQTPNG